MSIISALSLRPFERNCDAHTCILFLVLRPTNAARPPVDPTNVQLTHGSFLFVSCVPDRLYDEQGDDGESDEGDGDDEDDDPANMTAADLFGKPSKKLIQRYKGGNVQEGKSSGGGNANGADALGGGFGDYDEFEEDALDWKEGQSFDEDGDEGDDGGGEDGSDEEEEVPMAGGGEDDDGGDNADGNAKLSTHAIRSQKLHEQTLSLERDLMSEKPWKMMGEAAGSDRAPDSLLDSATGGSTPEFEVAFKPPPILDPAEHAADIEEMIKKRIIDEDWDDVVPRELPDIGTKRGSGDAPEVSQEKSKLGLGELYEREYLKKTAGYDRTADEKRTEEDAAKEEMRSLFGTLCSQLDALSNYQFAPRPVADEADVSESKDRPAIAMEEVLPLHVSGSKGAAPEEAYGAKSKVLKGETELDQVRDERGYNFLACCFISRFGFFPRTK